MKFQKKIFLLFLIIITLIIGYRYIKISDKKYVLANIKPNEIESIEIYQGNNSLTYNINDQESNKILKLIKNITKKGTFESLDGSYIYDNDLIKNLASEKTDSCFVKVNFISNTKVQLKNTAITCKYISIDLNNNLLYYWIQVSSSINEMTIENIDSTDLKKFINSCF